MATDPHFVQAGSNPALIGDGPDNLRCTCGESVLVASYHARQLVGIAIRCARCSVVTITDGLPERAILTGNVVAVDRIADSLDAGVLKPGYVLIDRAEMVRAEAPMRPNQPSTEPLTLSTAMLDQVVATYDRLTGGAFASHADASLPLHWTGVRRYPLAWAVLHLHAWLAGSSLPLMGPVETTIAAVHVGAFRFFIDSWGQHPLFEAMGAAAARTGFAIHALALFAAPAILFHSGNRIGFMTPPGEAPKVEDWSLLAGDRILALETVAFQRFAWPDGRPWSDAGIRNAIQDAVDGAKGRINARNHGLIVLSTGLVPEDMDRPMLEAMQRTFRSAGRANRGLAALAMLTPRVGQVGRPDQYGFAWLFRPVSNPSFEGDTRIAIEG